MNAFYGVMASAFYRFTDKRIGASITAFARENIQEIIRKFEEEGIEVIYGDTDSVFFKSKQPTLEQTVAFGREVTGRFSERGIPLEFERVMSSFFSHGKKKRYAGRGVWPKEEFVVRGYELRRTDAFDLQEEAQRAVFGKILDEDIEGAVKIARDVILRVQEGNIPVEQLVISRTVKDSGNKGTYVNPESMSNVQAARKLQDQGFEFTPGMKVSWVVTNARAAPQQVEPFVAGRPFADKPDREYYARRLALTLSHILEPFGWTEKSLLTGEQQASLKDSFEAAPKKVRKIVEIKRTDKQLTWDDIL